jgi:hypothetical protein
MRSANVPANPAMATAYPSYLYLYPYLEPYVIHILLQVEPRVLVECTKGSVLRIRKKIPSAE